MGPSAVRDLSLCATVTRGSLRAGLGASRWARLAGDVGVGLPECASHKIPRAPLSIYSPLKTASFVEWCCLGRGRWKFTSEKWKHKHSQFFISKMAVQCLVKWIVFLSLSAVCCFQPDLNCEFKGKPQILERRWRDLGSRGAGGDQTWFMELESQNIPILGLSAPKILFHRLCLAFAIVPTVHSFVFDN